jgi:hypothetical protein
MTVVVVVDIDYLVAFIQAIATFWGGLNPLVLRCTQGILLEVSKCIGGRVVDSSVLRLRLCHAQGVRLSMCGGRVGGKALENAV